MNCNFFITKNNKIYDLKLLKTKNAALHGLNQLLLGFPISLRCIGINFYPKDIQKKGPNT